MIFPSVSHAFAGFTCSRVMSRDVTLMFGNSVSRRCRGTHSALLIAACLFCCFSYFRYANTSKDVKLNSFKQFSTLFLKCISLLFYYFFLVGIWEIQERKRKREGSIAGGRQNHSVTSQAAASQPARENQSGSSTNIAVKTRLPALLLPAKT